MQLLFFLTEIGDALLKQSAADMGPSWDVTRMVNYHNGLGRMTITPPAGSVETQSRGVIFLQSYSLADGSLCLKANLSWQGSERYSTITVFSRPGQNWKTATAQIASSWLAGPPAANVSYGESQDLQPLLAVGM